MQCASIDTLRLSRTLLLTFVITPGCLRFIIAADTDLEDALPHQRVAPFAPAQRPAPAASEPWPALPTTQPDITLKAESNPSPSTAWQAHWLELRIHALQQQQQLYELKLHQLHQTQQKESQAAPLASDSRQLPGHSAISTLQVPAAAQLSGHAQRAGSDSAPSAPRSSVQPSTSISEAPNALQRHTHQQSGGGQAQRGVKRRRARWPMPGLSVAELANHPFFGQTGSRTGLEGMTQATFQGKVNK